LELLDERIDGLGCWRWLRRYPLGDGRRRLRQKKKPEKLTGNAERVTNRNDAEEAVEWCPRFQHTVALPEEIERRDGDATGDLAGVMQSRLLPRSETRAPPAIGFG